MTRRLTAICALITLLLTLGCGTKGPLYLPPAESAPQQDAGEKSEQ